MAQTCFPSLILASASARRRTLLTQHGFDFTCVPADVDEIAPDYLTPGEIVLYNAWAKALAIARRHPGSLVLGADTIVVFEGRVFGKPTDMEHAIEMLRQLNGREHEVYSGVWLCHLEEGLSRGFVENTAVTFHRRTLPELLAYASRIEPLDKAGAYAAQDDRGEIIRHIDGSFTNVVGLPMERLKAELGQFEPALS